MRKPSMLQPNLRIEAGDQFIVGTPGVDLIDGDEVVSDDFIRPPPNKESRHIGEHLNAGPNFTQLSCCFQQSDFRPSFCERDCGCQAAHPTAAHADAELGFGHGVCRSLGDCGGCSTVGVSSLASYSFVLFPPRVSELQTPTYIHPALLV